MAQGGIIYKGKKDSPDLLINDIWNAGCNIGYLPAIKQLAVHGPLLVEDILFKRLKIPFDRNKRGNPDLTDEGAHAVPRIIHSADSTGKTIHQHVMKTILKHPDITVSSRCTAIDLLTTGHSSINPADKYRPESCFGAYVFDVLSGKVTTVLAKETILATGGVGGLYLHTTNTETTRGDGIAMAKRVGARIINMEYIQFHPTGLHHPYKKRFLLSESLRGEGALLLNHLGKEFIFLFVILDNILC